MVLRAHFVAVNLLLARRDSTFRSVLPASDPPSPLTIVRGFLGVTAIAALLAAGFGYVNSGSLDWRLIALVLMLWGAWSFASTIYEAVLAPLAEFFGRQLFSGRSITIDDEAAFLEGELERPDVERGHEILSAIRLAEIYRRYRGDASRADALLDRMLVKYPDAPELQHVRRTA